MAGHLDVVQAVKAELEAQGVNLQGACGAFRILNRVANRLKPEFGLLLKAGGNRAVPQPDGSCLDGDHTSAPGYATDYLIERSTFFGYDILGDGGGANNPQWGEPETDAEMVKRNRENFREPVAWGEGPTPTPVPVPTPTPTPPPTPVPPADLVARVVTLERDLDEARGEIAVLETKVGELEQGATGEVTDLIARVVVLEKGSIGNVSKLVARVEALEAKKIPTGVRSTLSWNGVSSRLTYD